MVSLETVKLLESKVTQTIDFVKKVTGENSQLKEKLSSYQKRIEELEVLVQQFRENQNKIEDGILSALDRLNQFEDALESKLSTESKPSPENKPAAASKLPPDSKPSPESLPGKKPSPESKISIGSNSSGPIVVPEPPVKEEKTPETDLRELDIF